MRVTTTLFAVLSAVSSIQAQTTSQRYIVELHSRSHGDRVTDKIASLPGLRVVKRFDSSLFPAVSIECDHGCDSVAIARLLETTHADNVVASVYKSAPVRILPTEEGESFSDDAAASNYSVHGMTGVETLHNAGILGAGAKVAIVDSGIQYTHPALGGGIGPNYTVIGGYDLVGDGDWPASPPQPDNDPMDIYGHGTHVAGIIAGKSDQFVGVAPSAKLLSFKTFSKLGYSDEETVIEGFLMAFDSGADIISASLGEQGGYTANAWAVVASRMVEQGVVVVIAAGNNGQDGPFDASNGASGKKVLTIASAEPGEFPGQTFRANFSLDGLSNETQIAYEASATTGLFPATLVDKPITPLTLNTSVVSDACTALPADTADLSGSITLVRVGGCEVYTKRINLAAFNASYVLFYGNEGPYEAPPTGISKTFTGTIEAAAGEAIVNTILAGGNVTVSFDVNTSHYVGLYNSGSGRPAKYTSFGSTFDLALKPDVAAPGTKILSTYPTNGYRVLSGTSMATPYMAGIAALWVGKFGGRAAHAKDPAWAQRLITRIMSTAKTVPYADWATTSVDYGFWAPTTQMGAGLIDAGKLFSYTTDLNFEGRKFELNDTANFVGDHAVDITNKGTTAVTYTFALQAAGGYDSYIPLAANLTSYSLPRLKFYSELELVEMVPGFEMLQRELTVGPGETKTANFIFSVPVGLSNDKIPVYSGKILISGSNGEELGIPYFGVGCDLKKSVQNVFDYGSLFPFLSSGTAATKIDLKSNFTFNLTQHSQDFPHLNTKLAWGTAELRWDIFNANYTESQWKYPPVVGRNDFIGSATAWTGTAGLARSSFIQGQDSDDDIYSFPLYNQPRGPWNLYFWLGRYANGSSVVPGTYKFRIAALRPLGNPEVATDWDIWTTPVFTILPLV